MESDRESMELYTALALLKTFQDKHKGLPDEVVRKIEERYHYTIGRKS